MTNLPKIRTKYGEGIGVELFIEFPDISQNEKTFFDADEAAGQTTLSANGTNFAVDQYVVLGKPGAEKTEIVKLHASTPPTSSTITTGATVFAHSRGDQITFIPYNQIIVDRSIDGGNNFTPLTAVSIRPDSHETYIQRTSDNATDVYRVRFYNSTSTLYSAYSDDITASGYADNTVHAIKQRALDDLGEVKNALITDKFLNQSLWTARRELDEDDRVLRWEFRQKFNETIGSVVAGTWRLPTPSDLRDPNTPKNILGLRIGRDGRELKYLDVSQLFDYYENVGHATLQDSITTGSTTIGLSPNSGDFDESGTIVIAGTDYDDVVDTVFYTSNDGDQLEGVTGITQDKDITDAPDDMVDVWQNASFGLPRYFTIFDGYIYFDVPFADEYAGENIVMDYYGTLVTYNSDADVLDEPETDLFVAYLRFKIKYKKSNGMMENATKDTDFILWERGKERLVNKQVTGQIGYLIPS